MHVRKTPENGGCGERPFFVRQKGGYQYHLTDDDISTAHKRHPLSY